MSVLVANERTKLTAAAIDRASTACFAIGFLSPLVAGQVGHPSMHTGIYVAGWLLGAIVLHIAARSHLRRLNK